MTEASPASGARRHRLKTILLGSPALSVMLLAGNAAMAAPPTAGSLPGAFTTNAATGASYTGTGPSAATITVGTATGISGQVLQFGGASAGTTVSPLTSTGAALATATNPGFSVGSGAALTITGGAALPTLINDQTGSASQVYGSVNASGLLGPLFVANSNGVVVGAGGSFTAPTIGGIGLLGYSVDSATFGGSGAITVNSSTAGTGSVTVDPAATFSGAGTLLVASNGAVSVGAAPGAGVEVIAGYGFGTDPTTGAATLGTLLPGSAATVAFTGGTTTTALDVTALDAAGSVSNSGIVTLPTGGGTIAGAFTNTGIATVAGLSAGSITNAGTLNDSTGALTTVAATGTTTGADITNTGIINDSAATLTATAGVTGATGNFNNTGAINFTTAAATGGDSVTVSAANIQLAGSIAATFTGAPAPTALSATNALGTLALTAGYAAPPAAAPTGDIDYATTAYAVTPTLVGGAVRVLAGGLYNPDATGTVIIDVGSGSVADPFTGTTLGNNLSLFPNTMVQANTVAVNGTATTSTQVGSNINLDGVLSTQAPASTTGGSVTFGGVNNITGAGGLAFNDGGSFVVSSYTGNINNPYGATTAGSTAFQYNYLPVAVANSTSGTAGTVDISLTGQTASSGTAQFVNVLTKGNAVLVNTGAPPLAPPASTTGITPAASYTNNHLVVQATGNIGFLAPGTVAGSSTTTFYWPGLVYLNTVASATTPTTQSTSGSITLGTLVTAATPTSTAIALNNVLPAAVTGNAGIFLVTNNLNLDGSTVTTNANSWVNFVSTQVASAYATTSPSSFFNAYVNAVTPSVSQLSIQALPTGSFQ